MTEWVYKNRRSVSKHALRVATDPVTYCGVSVWNYKNWLGKKTETERVQLAALPPCGKCVGLMAR